jgi:DNA repair exonuclease SbcCD nuclease subunit
MRFIHCADIHLDSPLRGLERYEGAPVEEVRGATRRALENMIQCALRERVDFVVIAGDLYDGDWPDFNTGLFFAKAMAELGESGIAVYVIRGNHDAASKLTRVLPLPKNVHLFPDKAPSTQTDDNLGLAVHGQSFATAAVFDDLAVGYSQAIPGYFNLGVLHTSLTGRPGHDNYAPTTELVLKSKGYDYWALGHVHAREIVSRDPWIVYPGNTQGRHIREQGQKGCELVTVEDGQIVLEQVPLDVMRWGVLNVDVSRIQDLDALLDQVTQGVREQLAEAGGRVLGLRIQLLGAGPVYKNISSRPEVVTEQLRAVALDVSSGSAWVEKVDCRVRPALDLEQLALGDDPVGLLVRELRTLSADSDALALLASETLRELKQKLPAELAQADVLRFDATEVLKELLTQAEADLIARLASEGGER